MEDSNTTMDAILPLVPNVIIDQEVEDLSNTTFAKEPGMYQRVQKCFSDQLMTLRTDTSPGSLVFDTHNMEIIGNLKPDMSIVTAACSVPTVGAMIAAVELKVGKLNKDSFGQLYDYLKGIKAAQPNRRILIGLLSNLKENHFLVLECSHNAPTRCIHHQSVSLAVALTYIRDMVIPDASYHPPSSVFTADLGRLDQHLGNPAFSVLAVFPVPLAITTPEFAKNRWVDPDWKMPYGRVQMVVKRTTPGIHGAAIKSRAPRTVQNEIQVLLKLRQLAQADNLKGPKNLPQILYHNNSYDEFGILPRGFPLLPGDIGVKWPKVISDVLDALAWLHSHKIIHRDVRLDNIVWNIDHAVLIDLGTAVDLSRYSDTSSMSYNGGYVCCPPSIIGDLGRSYHPTPADDCLAVVLIVNTILFPARWRSFRSVELEKPGSPETRELGRFWKKMEASLMWRRFWKAGIKADYACLKTMEQFFVHL